VDRYNSVARTLHWTVALLIACLYVTNWIRSDAPHGSIERLWWLSAHESLGLLLLALSLGRFVWRLSHPAPQLHGSPMVRRLAAAGHGLLYLATIGLPLAGIARAFAANELRFFGLVLPASVDRSPMLAAITHVAHGGWVMDSLLALIAGHTLAALWHQFLLSDGTLGRMI
jgi:cytochrome b561